MRNRLRKFLERRQTDVKIPPLEREMHDHPNDKLFFVCMIVIASVSMLLYIGGSFVKAVRMAQQPQAVEQLRK